MLAGETRGMQWRLVKSFLVERKEMADENSPLELVARLDREQ